MTTRSAGGPVLVVLVLLMQSAAAYLLAPPLPPPRARHSPQPRNAPPPLALRASGGDGGSRIADVLAGACLGASAGVLVYSMQGQAPAEPPRLQQVVERAAEASATPVESGPAEPQPQLMQQVVERVAEASAIRPGADIAGLTKAGIRGVLAGLGDPYAALLTGNDLSRFRMQVDGRFGGVGVVLARPTDEARSMGRADDEIVVVGADDGAFSRGVRTGDVLVSVDGVEVVGMRLEQVRELVAGEMGSPVELRLQRPTYGGMATVSVSVTRGPLKRATVQSSLIPVDQKKAGFIKITNFDRSTAAEVREALSSLLQEGQDLGGLLIDLRDNGGGLLQSSIDVAAMLLPEGAAVVSVSTPEGLDITYESRGDRMAWGDARPPIAVLVNSRTASAAEVLAGAIQDSGIGLLVGPCPTQGKGLAQASLPVDLPGGEKGLIKLSVARYVTPKNREISGKGLPPDIVIESPDTGAFVSAATQQGIFFDWASAWLLKEQEPLLALEKEPGRAFQDLVDFSAKRAEQGRFLPGRTLKARLGSLEADLRRKGLRLSAESVRAVEQSLDQEILRSSEAHQQDALPLMRLALLSRSQGDEAMAQYRAESDATVMRCARRILMGDMVGSRGEVQIGSRENDVLERLYPDIDVMLL